MIRPDTLRYFILLCSRLADTMHLFDNTRGDVEALIYVVVERLRRMYARGARRFPGAGIFETYGVRRLRRAHLGPLAEGTDLGSSPKDKPAMTPAKMLNVMV